MADTPEHEPRWELLPHNPVDFFELDEGFDRKDLKRAYNRLLRQFKPEKFPAEFQRIRAAFEQLDENLRYHGRSAASRIPTPQDWKTDPKHSPESKAELQTEAAETRLVDRLKNESPAALYKELKERTHKLPFDYYALALLSDVVEKSAIGFGRWIIEGIAAHRQEGALKQLLHEYFRGPQTGVALLQLLPLAAKAIRTDEFYPITEAAWQVVLSECSFDQFASTFDRCESELRDSHIVGRMAFLIHILKTAMWRDESLEGWSARQFEFVEENFESIPPWLEWDVELLGLAREYLAVRSRFVTGPPLRARMDAALKAYFSESQVEGDRAIVAIQMELLGGSDGLMTAFLLEQSELLQKFFPIWAWASHDVAERQSIAQDVEVNENIWASRTVALLDRLHKQCNNSWIGTQWSICLGARTVTLGVIALFGVIAVVMLSIGASTLLAEDNQIQDLFIGVGTLVGILAGAIATLYWVKPYLDQKIWFPLNGKFAKKCYDTFWRKEVMDFQRRSHLPDRFFRALFDHFSDKSTTATWVNMFVQQDLAPALLAGAQRYEA